MLESVDPRSVFAVVVLVCIYWLLRRWRYNRHRINIKKAGRVLRKIRSFDGPDRNARIFSYLRKIDPFVFEELLLTAFKDQGFKIIRNKRYTGDGGIDGKVIDRNKCLILIQAKRYGGYINENHVQEFSDMIKNHRKAVKGYFIHTGKTGNNSKVLFSSCEYVELISGSSLIKLIDGVQK